MQAQQQRPLGVSVLAVLAAITGLASGFVAALYVGLVPLSLIGGGIGFFGLAVLGAALWSLVAFVWFWAAAGLWSLNPQALTFVIIIATLNLILAVISVLGASTWQVVLPSVVLNGTVLIYASTPGVRRAFGFPEQQR